MQRIRRSSPVVACLVALSASAGAAQAEPYTFIKIAEATGESFFDRFDNRPAVNADGVVAFKGGYLGGSGIYTGSGGPTTTIADSSGEFAQFGEPSINAGGTVAFFASPKTGGTGIYTHKAGTITPIALSSGPIFSGFNSELSINSGGTVAFYGQRAQTAGNGVVGIYTGNGGPITTVVQNTDPDFAAIGVRQSINDAGTVAFIARPSAASTAAGIFTRNASVTQQIVEASLPGAGSIFNGAPDAPSINSTGTVAFVVGNNPEGRGIYFGSGGTPLDIPDSGNPGSPTTFVDGRGPFGDQFYDGPAINDDGMIAFQSVLDAGFQGIFTGPDPILDKVIAVGDALFGSTVNQLVFGHQGLNNGGQIAFWYRLDQGSEGIALTAKPDPMMPEPTPEPTPAPEPMPEPMPMPPSAVPTPSAAMGGLTALAALALRRRRPRARV